MNFAFSTVGSTGTHFVTANGQLPVGKLQQTGNGALSQVVGMMGGIEVSEGVQYVRDINGLLATSALQSTPQLISLPIALPGAKPGDPQPTVQIQVLGPNILQAQQQQKYQMQIPISVQQGGAVLTVAYSPEAGEAGGFQLVGQNALPEGVQVLSLPQEMQLVQPSDDKTHVQPMHQVFITPNQQIIINAPMDGKLNNNSSAVNNNPVANIIIKEEYDDSHQDDESSRGEGDTWRATGSSQQELVKYLAHLPPQQTQQLPVSLQQFLKLNPKPDAMDTDERQDDHDSEAALLEEHVPKKKKKYKRKPPKPAAQRPGHVLITTAADGSVVYCCPECQMVYPEKEHLEMHLLVHKIERRFICGLCGAALKRKEHLERHKLGHNPERPYVCGVCRKGFKRREHLNLHSVIHTGVKTEMCQECGKGFYRKDHLRKHTRSHESKRARDEAAANSGDTHDAPAPALAPHNAILPEITIHVPTSSNMQMPVQINIPQHVVTSLAAAQQQTDSQAQLEELLAHHS